MLSSQNCRAPTTIQPQEKGDIPAGTKGNGGLPVISEPHLFTLIPVQVISSTRDGKCCVQVGGSSDWIAVPFERLDTSSAGPIIQYGLGRTSEVKLTGRPSFSESCGFSEINKSWVGFPTTVNDLSKEDFCRLTAYLYVNNALTKLVLRGMVPNFRNSFWDLKNLSDRCKFGCGWRQANCQCFEGLSECCKFGFGQ